MVGVPYRIGPSSAHRPRISQFSDSQSNFQTCEEGQSGLVLKMCVSMYPVKGRFSEARLVSWTLEKPVVSPGFRGQPQGSAGQLSFPWVTAALPGQGPLTGPYCEVLPDSDLPWLLTSCLCEYGHTSIHRWAGALVWLGACCHVRSLGPLLLTQAPRKSNHRACPLCGQAVPSSLESPSGSCLAHVRVGVPLDPVGIFPLWRQRAGGLGHGPGSGSLWALRREPWTHLGSADPGPLSTLGVCTLSPLSSSSAACGGLGEELPRSHQIEHAQ